MIGKLLGCNNPDRYPAKIIMALKGECPCCSLYRAAAAGLVIGTAITSAVILLVK